MKPIKDWLNDLPEPYRSQALENHSIIPIRDTEKQVSKLSYAMFFAFPWDVSPQGSEYWGSFYVSICKAETEADSIKNRWYNRFIKWIRSL